jgi:hypothetical protein
VIIVFTSRNTPLIAAARTGEPKTDPVRKTTPV